ncbi:hypothetical protein [Methylophaga sp. OBS3]|uniref:hypothetical protein n=1 Tax=Methylophaga sp. OBS3 TaxID=2991934 RepID=UPI00225049FF|nr:hypothetical protein [Methylophaga sp. OBS3]MCX4188912.1 hypothetical protein [Methylophaga sp. OBS3]
MKFKILCVLVTALFIAGCGMPKMVQHTTKGQVSSPNKVVVIGRFVLTPSVLTDIEQQTHWNVVGDERIINTVFMATGPNNQPASAQLGGSDWQQTIEVQWGQPFMVELDKRTTWLNGGFMFLDALKQERLWFPGGFYFDVPKDAGVIYIGTLHYIRNEFNTVKHIEVINELTETIAALNVSADDVTVSLMQFPEAEKLDVIASLY